MLSISFFLLIIFFLIFSIFIAECLAYLFLFLIIYLFIWMNQLKNFFIWYYTCFNSILPNHPPSPSPTESKRLFYTSVSLLLSCIQGCRYHLSKFHIYALVYCLFIFKPFHVLVKYCFSCVAYSFTYCIFIVINF